MGSEVRSVDGGAHLRGRRRQGIGRGLLARQRSVKVNLKQPGELRIEPCHRPGSGVLDYLARIGRRDGERRVQPGVVIQRGPRRKLPGQLRALEHLLGVREELDDFVGRLGMFRTGVDGQLLATKRSCASARAGPAKTSPIQSWRLRKRTIAPWRVRANTQRLKIVLKATVITHAIVQRLLSRMAEWRVPKIMGETDRLDQRLVEI